jgi:hypothetical protein
VNHTMDISIISNLLSFLAICYTLLLSKVAIEPYCEYFDDDLRNDMVLSLLLMGSNHNDTLIGSSKIK